MRHIEDHGGVARGTVYRLIATGARLYALLGRDAMLELILPEEGFEVEGLHGAAAHV